MAERSRRIPWLVWPAEEPAVAPSPWLQRIVAADAQGAVRRYAVESLDAWDGADPFRLSVRREVDPAGQVKQFAVSLLVVPVATIAVSGPDGEGADLG